MQSSKTNNSTTTKTPLPTADDYGTAEMRRLAPGARQVIRIQRANDIYNLRAKAYRWNDIEGKYINCKLHVYVDRQHGLITVAKEITTLPREEQQQP